MVSNTLTLSFKTASYDLAPSGQLSVPSLMRYFQQVAHIHAAQLNVGYHLLKERNIYWVLTGINLQTGQLPEFDVEFTVETWPRENIRLFSMRDFMVYSNQKIVARATTSWLMVDANSKRPVRPESILQGIKFLSEKKAISSELLTIENCEDYNYRENRIVQFSDLDINRHVNNTRYIEWVFDAIHKTGFKNRKTVSLSMLFSNEFTEGESATILIKGRNKNIVNVVIEHNDGKPGVKAAIEFTETSLP